MSTYELNAPLNSNKVEQLADRQATTCVTKNTCNIEL